ncbi:uncharacterized protein LOC135843204 [Planococcus citri]|uniref:uncharacterized protein LOC135843204 n=1 Tax=Planococcus citri TaxID=170843 RepID=UPI0031F8F1E6
MATIREHVRKREFEKKKVILSLGTYELNYGNIRDSHMRRLLREIVGTLKEKGVEDIKILFPMIFPAGKNDRGVTAKRYYAWRRIFEEVCDNESVTLWWSPAAVFIRLIRLEDGRLRFQPDKSGKVIPRDNRLQKKASGYVPNEAGEKELLFEMKKCYNHKFKPKNSVFNSQNLCVETSTNLSAEVVTESDGDYLVTTKESIEKTKAKMPESSRPIAQIIEDLTKMEVKLSPDWQKKVKMVCKAWKNKQGQPMEETSSDEETTKSSDGAPANHHEVAVNQAAADQSSTPESDVIDEKRTDPNTVEPLVRSQIENFDQAKTCVVPLRFADLTLFTQLDSGATPNIMSETCANNLINNYKEKIEFIYLKRVLQCRLANNQVVRTWKKAIVVPLKFGKHKIKVPFFVMPGDNKLLLIGTKSIEKLDIKTDVKKGTATCRPPGTHRAEEVVFAKRSEYRVEDMYTNQIQLEEEYQKETVEIVSRADLHSFFRKDGRPRDDGPEIFERNLRRYLGEAVREGRITKAESEEALEELLKFRDVFSRFPGKYKGAMVKLKFVDPNKIPNFVGPKYNPSNKQLDKIRRALADMVEQEVAEPSDTTYINPLVPNEKKDGSVRLCLNPVELNPILQTNYNEAGLLDRIITSDGEARFFTTLDFTTAFWQLVLDPESRKYTGFKVDGRVYQMIRLPYGLKISSAEFVKVINEVIPDMPGVTKYVDDLLLRSLTFSEMLRLLKKVLELLREHGLKLNPNKCKFFASSTDHLGFNISTRSIKKQSKKIEGYLEYIQKKTLKRTGKVKLGNVRDVLTLIGLTGIYSRFIPNYQDIVKPLYDLTRKGVPFVWGTAQEEAVEKLTVEFTKEFELMSPVDGEDLYLDTVSTEHSLNGVLYQNIKGEDKVVMFVSSAFKQHQQNYTLIEREMFALVRVINKLQLWLHGRRIHVRGDLQSVVHKFTTLAKVHRKAAGWITELNCYDLVYDLKHKVRGQWYGIQAPELTVYDTNWTNMVPLDVSFVELVKDEVLDHLRRLDIFQSRDRMCTKIVRKLNASELDMTAKQLESKRRMQAKYAVIKEKDKELLFRKFKDGSRIPVMPDELFRDTIFYLHEMYGHIGAHKLEAVFKRLYYSPNIVKTTRIITSECITCRKTKGYSEKKRLQFSQIEAFNIADVISADLCGPIANEYGEPKYMFVAKCVFTSKVWIIPLESIPAETVVHAMETVLNDIEKLGHKVHKVITDNGSQFRSEAWNEMLTANGIKIGHTTTYNPQSSLVERTMRIIGDRLRAKLNDEPENDEYTHHGWHVHVKKIESEINNTPTEFGIKPNEVWGIEDEFSANMPTKLAKLNSKYLLKKLQQDQIEKNPKSVTTETLMEKPMELSNLIRDEDGYYWAAVDGACSNNGSSDAIAGIGVAWTPTGEFNISERVDHPRYRNTNNLAEAIALCKAMKVMLKLGAKRGKIFSDSCYLTTAINYNVEKWKINNWKNASKKPVVHREIFQEILELKEKFEKFELKHTPARSFDRNNHAADKLARKAVYTQELVDLRVDEMTEQQALISFIREKRKLQRSRDEVAFYKIKGDPICYEEGELVMLTEHRQSSYDKGVSKKLFPKRFGPYMVMKHVGDNAYRVRSIANESDEQIVNARQMTIYLNLEQQEKLKNDPKLKSKTDSRPLIEKIKEKVTPKEIERPEIDEEVEEEVIDSKIHDQAAERAARLLARELRKKELEQAEEKRGKKLQEFQKLKKHARRKLDDKENEKIATCIKKAVGLTTKAGEILANAEKKDKDRKRTKKLKPGEKAPGSDDPDYVPPTSTKRRKKKTVNFIALEKLESHHRVMFVELYMNYEDVLK